MLSVDEVAAMLGLKSGTVRLWLVQRRLPHLKAGRSVRIPKAAVLEFIEKNLVPAREQ